MKWLFVIADSIKVRIWEECQDEDNFVKTLTVSGCAAMPRFLNDSIPSLLMPNFCSVLDRAPGNELDFRIHFWLSETTNEF